VACFNQLQAGRLHLKCDGTRAETDFIFRRNGRVHLNQQGHHFSRLLAAEVCEGYWLLAAEVCEGCWLLAAEVCEGCWLLAAEVCEGCWLLAAEVCEGYWLLVAEVCEGYWLLTPFANFPFTSPPVCHHAPSCFNWTLILHTEHTTVHHTYISV